MRTITLLALFLAGCGPTGPTTHPVTGAVELTGADVAQLAGWSLELSLEQDATVRAFGAITPEGRFDVKSLQGGKVQTGAVEGTYRARLIPAPDDGPSRKPTPRPVAVRFLKFETSGLKVDVPAAEPVRLRVASR